MLAVPLRFVMSAFPRVRDCADLSSVSGVPFAKYVYYQGKHFYVVPSPGCWKQGGLDARDECGFCACASELPTRHAAPDPMWARHWTPREWSRLPRRPRGYGRGHVRARGAGISHKIRLIVK